LISSIFEIAEIGKLNAGGCKRLAFSKEDFLAKKKLINWCKEINLNLTMDNIGNIFAKYENTYNSKNKSIGIGSHLDTQPHGGKFDGSYGVLSALEVIRIIKEKKIFLKNPLELIIWSNEEGCKYTPPLMGSLFFTKKINLKQILKQNKSQNLLLQKDMKYFEKLKLKNTHNKKLHSFIEIHIEQGPVLENIKKSIGIVTGAQGSRGFLLEFIGEDAHSGTTPMNLRKDTVVALSNFIVEFNNESKKLDQDLKATVGNITTLPGSRNTVAGTSHITIDIRHPNSSILDSMEKKIIKILNKIKKRFNVTFNLELKYKLPTVDFDKNLISLIKSSCLDLNYSYNEMMSGAGHDAVSISRLYPSAMIFIPCLKGISHNEKEFASNKDMVRGCNLLLETVLKISK
ncbi:M20 family metallo-hydrolase, partial [Alphaproteobacteria bacterium]|nr:M20 family metallo-hydrolase [Alphaproteobacteria bacterium]